MILWPTVAPISREISSRRERTPSIQSAMIVLHPLPLWQDELGGVSEGEFLYQFVNKDKILHWLEITFKAFESKRE